MKEIFEARREQKIGCKKLSIVPINFRRMKLCFPLTEMAVFQFTTLDYKSYRSAIPRDRYDFQGKNSEHFFSYHTVFIVGMYLLIHGHQGNNNNFCFERLVRQSSNCPTSILPLVFSLFVRVAIKFREQC